jgi:hypothetical protein
MFFYGCIKNCFIYNNTDADFEQLYSLNKIIKIKIYDNQNKIPEPVDKLEFNNFINKMNLTCKMILGGSIEFIVINPSDFPILEGRYIKYIINMRNTKTLLIMNTYNFVISFDENNILHITIDPYKNEKVSLSEWNFLENLFYNMNYKTIKYYDSLH